MFRVMEWFVRVFGAWAFLVMGALVTLIIVVIASIVIHFTYDEDDEGWPIFVDFLDDE
jgi:hypothetical protein